MGVDFFLLISAAFACGQEPSDLHAKDELAIRRVDGEWLKRFDALDVKGLDLMEADDFTVAGSTDHLAVPILWGCRCHYPDRPRDGRKRHGRPSDDYRLDSSQWRLEGDSPAFLHFA